ncbi:MAG: EfeM/EfeO family lipoprotein [Quadrisphaera sp.]
MTSPPLVATGCPAQLTWERVGASYDSFGDLGEAVDGLPQGHEQGVDDPDFTGLHRLEHGLFHGQSAAQLLPVADQLATDVAAVQAHLGDDDLAGDPDPAADPRPRDPRGRPPRPTSPASMTRAVAPSTP